LALAGGKYSYMEFALTIFIYISIRMWDTPAVRISFKLFRRIKLCQWRFIFLYMDFALVKMRSLHSWETITIFLDRRESHIRFYRFMLYINYDLASTQNYPSVLYSTYYALRITRCSSYVLAKWQRHYLQETGLAKCYARYRDDLFEERIPISKFNLKTRPELLN